MQENKNGSVIHVGNLMAMIRKSNDFSECQIDYDKQTIKSTVTTREGSRSLIALLCVEGEPLAVSSIKQIDERIEVSDFAWRNWAENLKYE
ncbi:hypothetical protein AKO1_007329, partial [Acrasis kona]